MNTNNKILVCPNCGYEMESYQWQQICHYEYDGKYIYERIGGDHIRCPWCNELSHIDYDLLEK